MPKRFYKADSPLIPYRGKQAGQTLPFLLLGLLVVSGCTGFRACDQNESWTGSDKAKHFTAAAIIGGGVTAIATQETDSTEAATIGMATAMAAGLGKEWYDLEVKKSCFSWKDLVWDFIGASAGVSVAAWATD
jgi:uncharacterized protein YfiM (DUF2279 family)